MYSYIPEFAILNTQSLRRNSKQIGMISATGEDLSKTTLLYYGEYFFTFHVQQKQLEQLGAGYITCK